MGSCQLSGKGIAASLTTRQCVSQSWDRVTVSNSVQNQQLLELEDSAPLSVMVSKVSPWAEETKKQTKKHGSRSIVAWRADGLMGIFRSHRNMGKKGKHFQEKSEVKDLHY